MFVSEGLVKECPDKKEMPERVAENYLSDLIDLNLIQVAEKKIDGRVKTCCLPSALQEHNFCQSTSTNSRIADYFAITLRVLMVFMAILIHQVLM